RGAREAARPPSRMSRNVRLGLFAAAGAMLAALLVWGFTGLPAFGDFQGEYGWILNDVAGHERHVTNVVASVVFDYRGFDTLGEEFILFAAVGVAALFAGGLFLENVVELGTRGTLASGGTIPILNAAAGLEVTAAVVLLLHEFLEEVMYPA